MKLMHQRVDLRRFLESEIPLDAISPDLRQNILHALGQGHELTGLAARAARELMLAGVLRPYGSMRVGEGKIALYGVEGSARLFDLRTLLGEDAGDAAVAAADLPSETAPEVPAEDVSRPNGNAWASLRAIRSTLRRDWVSFGLESSLDSMIEEIRARLGQADLQVVFWEKWLALPLNSGDGWEVLSSEDSDSVALWNRVSAAPALGVEHGGRRWCPLWAHDSVVGAVGASTSLDPPLVAEVAGTISDLILAAVRSQRRVFTDPLTGVHNRGFFDRQFPLELERARRAGISLTLLFVDIDHFKVVNDSRGHDVGDVVLQHVASVLVGHLRRIDYVFRYGGEEFAIVLPGTDGEEALQTADRLRQTVAGTPAVLPGDGTLAVTVSIGGAIYPEHGHGEQELLRLADQAMYRAKGDGRDRVVFWDPSGP